MIWHPRTEADARRMAWDDDDWDGGIAHCVEMLGTHDGPVVDFGCGPGRLTALVGSPAVGFDPNPKMLPRRKRKGATFTSEMPPPESAAFVFSVLVFQHLPHDDQRRSLEDMATIGRPGGTVKVQFVPDGDTGPLSHPTPPPLIKGWAEALGLSAEVDDDPVFPTWRWLTAVKP